MLVGGTFFVKQYVVSVGFCLIWLLEKYFIIDILIIYGYSVWCLFFVVRSIPASMLLVKTSSLCDWKIVWVCVWLEFMAY